MWEERNNTLCRDFTFENFLGAFGFIAQVALLAEAMNHHPTLTNTYNQVRIQLCTHDANNTVTEKDRILARAIDALPSIQHGNVG